MENNQEKTKREILEEMTIKNIMLAKKIYKEFWPLSGNYDHSSILRIAKMIQLEREFVN